MTKDLRKMSFIQLKSHGIRLPTTMDSDSDSVPNSLDCKPLNINEQGWLHDKYKAWRDKNAERKAEASGQQIERHHKEEYQRTKDMSTEDYNTYRKAYNKEKSKPLKEIARQRARHEMRIKERENRPGLFGRIKERARERAAKREEITAEKQKIYDKGRMDYEKKEAKRMVKARYSDTYALKPKYSHGTPVSQSAASFGSIFSSSDRDVTAGMFNQSKKQDYDITGGLFSKRSSKPIDITGGIFNQSKKKKKQPDMFAGMFGR